MNATEALHILRALADGVDPQTGEEFPGDSPYQNPQIVRALFRSIAALEEAEEKETRKRENKLPGNAGKAWDAAEDKTLGAEFEAGISIRELAQKHERTEGAIQSRLVRLGKVQLPS